MEQPDVARVGVVLLMAMSAVFALGGLDRPGLYIPIQLIGVLVCIPAFRKPDSTQAFALLFGGLAFVRIIQVVLDLSRLPVWLNLSIGAAELVAMAACLTARPALARTSTWLVAVLFFVAMVTATSSGRIPALLGLLCGVIGFSLVAPNLSPASRGKPGRGLAATDAL